jgi:hypothetical protein
MPKIEHIVVATRNPGEDPRDKGAAEEGFYTVEGDTLTMVTVDGTPLRSADGHRITARLAPGEDAKKIAARHTLSRWRSERAREELVPGFNSPIRYSAPYGGY